MTDRPTRPDVYVISLNPDAETPLARRGITLSAVADEIENMPRFRVRGRNVPSPQVKRLGGRGREPLKLAARLDASSVRRLKARYGDGLFIEPDHDLDIF